MNVFGDSVSAIALIAGILAGLGALAWWLGRCRHPNPHYVKAVVARDDARGREVVLRPPQYECYECGEIWPVEQRDAAWTPTRLVQKFSGFDETKAVQAARRAIIEEEQRRFLASHRIVPPHARTERAAPEPEEPRQPPRNGKVVDLNSRKPA